MIKLKECDSKRLSLILLMILGLFMLVSCTASQQQRVYHGFIMKGSIVQMTNDGVILCVGSRDGATVGQELEVWRTIYGRGSDASSKISTGSISSGEISEKMVGKVKITKIVNEHYALAKVISGEARLHDIVAIY